MKLWINTSLWTEKNYIPTIICIQKGTSSMPNPPEELQVTWLRILEKVQESLSKVACE